MFIHFLDVNLKNNPFEAFIVCVFQILTLTSISSVMMEIFLMQGHKIFVWGF